jgi:hypothetical protein
VAILKKQLYDLPRLWIIENFLPIGLEIDSRVSRHCMDFLLSGKSMFVVAQDLISGSRVENWQGINPF